MLIPQPPVSPRLVHKFVIDLCNKIVPRSLPVRIPVKPDASARVNECFFNVRNKIARDGGEIQHGWAIWERPGLFIEAEFHGVWVSPEMILVDVTPKVDGETEILFLPDPDEVFDERSYVRRDNIRLAEYDHPVVHEFIRQCEVVRKYEESCTNPDNPRQRIIDRDTYRPLLQRQAELESQMLVFTPGRNTVCRCRSGKKFKRCCGAAGQ
jgi:hypothetical protein